MINNISVSIITVTYNSAATLSRTMESVLEQSVSPLEYIIVDGKSTDNTLETAEGYRRGFEEKGILLRIISEPDKGIYDAMMFYADLKMHMPSGGTFIKKARYRRYATSRDWNHPTTCITREMYKKYKYRNETIHDDYDLILRLRKAGAKTVVRNVVIADFTMNGTSHERSLKKAFERVRIKYGIYRDNGYSPLYFFECFLVEMAKLIVG